MLYGMELGGPVLLTGLRPLSWHEREEVERRLGKIADHPVPVLRMLPQLFKIMVSFSAYSRPDVEAFLGVERRRWRDARKVFRDRLVEIEAGRSDPPTPTPLVDAAMISPEDYLRFDAVDRLEEAAGG